jgi:hypothetical protein
LQIRPILFMLHATGGHSVQFICDCGHSGTIYIQLAVSRMQTLHALSASCMQSRQFFASMLRKQLLEIKNEDDITKSENHVLAKPIR